MAVTQVSFTNNLYRLVKYLDKEQAHNENEHNDGKRNMIKRGHRVTTQNGYYEMYETMKRHNRLHNQQAMHTIISFSKDELPPDDPLSYERAFDIALETEHENEKKYNQERQTMFFVQSDGEGENVHVHKVSLNCSLDGELINGTQRTFKGQAMINDKVCEKHGLSTLEPVNKKEKGLNKYEKVMAENIKRYIGMYQNDEQIQSVDELQQQLMQDTGITIEQSDKANKDGEYDDVYIVPYTTKKGRNRKKSIPSRKIGDNLKRSDLNEFYQTRQVEKASTITKAERQSTVYNELHSIFDETSEENRAFEEQERERKRKLEQQRAEQQRLERERLARLDRQRIEKERRQSLKENRREHNKNHRVKQQDREEDNRSRQHDDGFELDL